MTKQRKDHVVGIAWYRAEQWSALREFCEDSEEIESTHAAWKRGAEKAMRALRREGQAVEPVDFDLEEFKVWCAVNGTKPIGASRSEFTAQKLRETRAK